MAGYCFTFGMGFAFVIPYHMLKLGNMQMADQLKFEDLTMLELNVMVAHLRLGIEHIKKHLNNKQLNNLLRLGSLNSEQHENIKSDKIEKSGQMALVINTIFTCAFGTWLGVTGFLGFGLGPKPGLIIVALISFLISGYFGFESYRLVDKQAKTAIAEQKLNNLELKLLKIILKKKHIAIDDIINYLNSLLKQFTGENNILALKNDNLENKFKNYKEIESWLNALTNIVRIKNESIDGNEVYKFYTEELETIINYLKKSLSNNISIAQQERGSKWRLSKEYNDSTSFIRILTDPTIANPKAKVKPKAWLKNNFAALAIGLIPTLLGGFGSLFVYFGGIPNMAKDLGFEQLAAALTNPIAKSIELVIAIGVTIYFGISYIHSNRKSFKRSQEIENAQSLIPNQESANIEANAKLNFLRKLKRQMRKIDSIFNALNRIKNYLDKNQETMNAYKKEYYLLKRKLEEMQMRFKTTLS